MYYKVINKYGKAITVKLKGIEQQQFKTVDFARLLAKRLNEDERKPKWLVNGYNWKLCRPYLVDTSKF